MPMSLRVAKISLGRQRLLGVITAVHGRCGSPLSGSKRRRTAGSLLSLILGSPTRAVLHTVA